MATVNFSVPEAVKEAFNAVFRGKNKSAIIAELMMKAVAEARAQRLRARAIRRILARRPRRHPVTNEAIRAARRELREWP